MRTPLVVRPLTDAERAALTSGLRSPDAFVLRRCQILLASARGERAPRIAEHLGCDDQTVLAALHACNAPGLEALRQGSSRPQRLRPAAFGRAQAAALRALFHHRPRRFGKPTSRWTLELAAEVSCAHGVTATKVTGDTIGQPRQRLGIGWKRAKQWSTSPDPASIPKNGGATA